MYARNIDTKWQNIFLLKSEVFLHYSGLQFL